MPPPGFDHLVAKHAVAQFGVGHTLEEALFYAGEDALHFGGGLVLSGGGCKGSLA